MAIDRDALVRTFLAQSEENLRAMEEALVALEKRPEEIEVLHDIFRRAHRVKGDSMLLGFTGISEFTHLFEELLGLLRERKISANASVVSMLLRGVDALGEMVGEIGKGTSPSRAKASKKTSAETGTVSAPALSERQEEHEPSADLQQTKTIRVDTDKLDRILNLTGEIAINREQLGRMLEGMEKWPKESLLEAHRVSDRLYMDLQEIVMKSRMVPLGPVFRQMIRAVRDLSQAQGKMAELVIQGEEAEVDTAVIDHLRDPLTHMIRNAVDHGIQLPEARRAAGKDPCGRIVLRAYHEVGNVVIQMQDDGAGLNRRRIRERAKAAGLSAEPEKLADGDLLRLIFEPGFSTAEKVTSVSGRGVGMDIVKRNVELLRGTVAVSSEEGNGTTITIRLPLTMAIIAGFSVGVEEETYIIPLSNVEECLEMPRENGFRTDQNGIINLRGKTLPYVRLRSLFGLSGAAPERESVVVVQHPEGRAGIVVDALHGESQTVIKPLAKIFNTLPGVSGSAVLGTGRVALILDISGLLQETLKQATALSLTRSEP
jgi:two-component system chemotaxis sensor kinase CheA